MADILIDYATLLAWVAELEGLVSRGKVVRNGSKIEPYRMGMKESAHMAAVRRQVASRNEQQIAQGGTVGGDTDEASNDAMGGRAVGKNDAKVGANDGGKHNAEDGTKRAGSSRDGGGATLAGDGNEGGASAPEGAKALEGSMKDSAEKAAASNAASEDPNEGSAAAAAAQSEDYSHESRLDAMFASDEIFVGMRVVHERRGAGEVVEIREDSNEVIVRFDSGGQHEYTPHTLHKLWREVAQNSQEEGSSAGQAKPASMLERKDEDKIRTYGMADLSSMLGRAGRIRKTKQDGHHVTVAYHYIAAAEHALHLRNYAQACREYDVALRVVKESEVGSDSRLGAQVRFGRRLFFPRVTSPPSVGTPLCRRFHLCGSPLDAEH